MEIKSKTFSLRHVSWFTKLKKNERTREFVESATTSTEAEQAVKKGRKKRLLPMNL